MLVASIKVQAYLTKCLSGSNKPDREATSDIVVLSPPGMIRASHLESSADVRTSIKDHVEGEIETVEAADVSSVRCSRKAPWSARTPTVISPIICAWIDPEMCICVSQKKLYLRCRWSHQAALGSGSPRLQSAAISVTAGLLPLLSNRCQDLPASSLASINLQNIM